MAMLIARPQSSMRLPHPSFSSGRMPLLPPVSAEEPLYGSLQRSSLTLAQNNRLELIERAQRGTPQGEQQQEAPAVEASQALEAQRQKAYEAELAARIARFQAEFSEVEAKMGMMQCPTNTSSVEPTAAASRSRPRSSADDEPKPPTELQMKQMKSSQRLFSGQGGSVGVGAPPSRRSLGPPPAVVVENRLKMLRTDPIARNELRKQCIIHERNRRDENLRRGRDGIPRNFVEENVHKATRPRSAGSASVHMLGRRPAFRPGGAPADAYVRPESAPSVRVAWGARAAPTMRTAPMLSEQLGGPAGSAAGATPMATDAGQQQGQQQRADADAAAGAASNAGTGVAGGAAAPPATAPLA